MDGSTRWTQPPVPWSTSQTGAQNVGPEDRRLRHAWETSAP